MPLTTENKQISLLDQIFASLSSVNFSTLKTAINAGSAKVCYIGHSIVEGENQNWPSSGVYNIMQRQIQNAFPSVDFSFINLGLGGRLATQYGSAANILDNTGYVGKANDNTPSTGFYRAPKGSSFFQQSWLSKTGSPTNGSTLNKSWRNHVLAESPDLVFVHFDLNDTDVKSFATAMQFIVDDFNTHSDWSAKRPSIILVSSHTGVNNPALIKQFAKVLRGLALKNNVAIVDGARVYELLTTGIDQVFGYANGEAFFRYDGAYNTATSFTLNTAYWANIVGVGYSPNGLTLRDQSSGTLVALRKRACADVTVTGIYSSYNASSVASIFYRADPNTLTNTAERYEVRIAGTTLSLIYQAAGGSQTTIATASVPGISGSSSHHIRVECIGSKHRVLVNGVEKISTHDFNCFTTGYAGIGISGNAGAWNKGTNLTNGFYFEFLEPVVIGNPIETDASLLGAINDFATNPDSSGGNAINHLANDGYYKVYTPAMAVVIKQIQSSL